MSNPLKQLQRGELAHLRVRISYDQGTDQHAHSLLQGEKDYKGLTKVRRKPKPYK